MPANGPVSVFRQTIYCLIPIGDLYAAYHVKKLRMYLLITIIAGLAMSMVGEIINPSELSDQSMTSSDKLNPNFGEAVFGSNPEISMAIMITYMAIAYAIAIYFIRKWSIKWNERF